MGNWRMGCKLSNKQWQEEVDYQAQRYVSHAGLRLTKLALHACIIIVTNDPVLESSHY